MKELIDKLVGNLDRDTYENLNPDATPLLLFGGKDSRYLKGINAKAKKLGIPVSWSEEEPPFVLQHPYIIDQEYFRNTSNCPTKPYYDIDGMTKQQTMSCTAAACLYLLLVSLKDFHNVCIIGRGHAVKGLADTMLKLDKTVTVCHSKSLNVHDYTAIADVIINAAPTTHPLVDITRKKDCVILDISGSLSRWEGSNTVTYVSMRDIGRLNTSIALNRLTTANTIGGQK